MADYANDIAALTSAFGIKPYVMVGHSMGGKIALSLAARRPPGLHSLILLAPSPPTPEPTGDAERTWLLSTHAQRAAAEETVRKVTARPLSGRVFAQAVEDSLRSSLPAWNAWLLYGSREDISLQTPFIDVPVLVAAGEADPVLPGELLQREVLARLPSGQMIVLPESGHLSPLEVPALVAGLIAGTLAHGS